MQTPTPQNADAEQLPRIGAAVNHRSPATEGAIKLNLENIQNDSSMTIRLA